MNPLQRTIKSVIEADLLIASPAVMQSSGKKLFQLVKHVTGKKVSEHTDYEVIPFKNDTYVLSGKRGFVRVTLEPLFTIEE